MSYRIDYGGRYHPRERIRKTNYRIPAYVACFLFAFVLLVRGSWTEGSTKLAEWLLPTEPGPIHQAYAAFMSEIMQGEPLGESIAVFCRQIILNGS